MTYYSNPPSGGSFQCYPNTQAPYDEIIACPEGDFQVAYKCPGQGLGLYLNYTCPSTERVPTCYQWSNDVSDYILADGCTVTNYYNGNTTCSCSMPEITPSTAPTSLPTDSSGGSGSGNGGGSGSGTSSGSAMGMVVVMRIVMAMALVMAMVM